VEKAAIDVLERAGGRPGHVFNLGHGVLAQTDPDALTRLAAFVHERTAVARLTTRPVSQGSSGLPANGDLRVP
jgi:hypothetical protein